MAEASGVCWSSESMAWRLTKSDAPMLSTERTVQLISVGLELEAVGESLSLCTRGQGELVGAGGFINVAAVLLGKCAGNQTAEEVPDNESTDASGWFAQCNEASKAEC